MADGLQRLLAMSTSRLRVGDERGQTFVEYALVLVLVAVAVAVLAAWGDLATAISDALATVADTL